MSKWSSYSYISDLVFRISLSLIFIVGGLGHFLRHHWMLQRLEGSPWIEWVLKIGSPSLLLWVSGAVMVVAGSALLLGLFTRLSALALFVTLVPITFVVHIAPDHVGPLLKNIAILGGLVHFFVTGAGNLSIDRYRRER
ncbi:MAG: DoxX family protein [Gammaproteobacteria bacterium]|nr:DoxX family protein [Gammaproteobacteria bacterium]